MTTAKPALRSKAGLHVACLGECMVELAHVTPGTLQMAFGGDTSNTAVYLTRLSRDLAIEVDFVTALGDDLYSEAMLAFWRDEGVGTRFVTQLKNRLPGLYTIHTDDAGERSFTYWRGQSAARDFLKSGRDVDLVTALSGFDLVYLSGITLSILDDAQREVLMGLLDAVRRAGCKVAFDGNFRPAGWPDLEAARFWFRQVFERTDIALPTLDDEQALFGDSDAAMVAARLHDHAVADVVIKCGAAGCWISTFEGAHAIPTLPIDPVVDSTAAGDSFNAGYLLGRLLARSNQEAARLGHHLAASVICYRGAIIPKDAMPREIFLDSHDKTKSQG